MNMKSYSLRQYALIMAAAIFAIGSIANAEWVFDDASKTFVLDPSLVTGDLFEHQWRVDSTVDPNFAESPETYIYEHDMSFATSSWYALDPYYNLRSYANLTGSEAAADYRLVCQPGGFESGGIVGLRSTTWHNANQPDLTLDHYNAFSSDDGSTYTEYFREDNWDLGLTPGTGYGEGWHSHSSQQVMVDLPGTKNRLRYGVEDLTAWDEWYGASWRVWAKSAELTYSDNYETDPFDALEGGTFWSHTGVTWDETNHRIKNSYSTNPSEVVYLIAHDGPIHAADIRLTDTTAESNATAAFAINGGAAIHVAISTDNVTYTDIYSGGWVQTQESNPGALVDLESYGYPEVLFVKIYATPSDTGSYYIYWSGFQVELTAPIATCEKVWYQGQGMAADINKDCRVDLADLASMAANWMECNNPVTCPEAWTE